MKTLGVTSTVFTLLVVGVPVKRVPTLYARTGEIVPLAALAFYLATLVRWLRARRRSEPAPAG